MTMRTTSGADRGGAEHGEAEQAEAGIGRAGDGRAEDGGAPWDCLARWTEAEREWWAMGPFDGGVPGMVRRVRRILDVSQRGLAALLDVSQSMVARWETGRTSPRADMVLRLLRMAGLVVGVRDRESGEPVGPMRADGARKHGGSRFPAHTDLRVTGWWVPRRIERVSSVEAILWADRSRAERDPAIRCTTSPWRKRVERMLRGVPDDHPAVHQLAAEAEHIDERRADRRAELLREWRAA